MPVRSPHRSILGAALVAAAVAVPLLGPGDAGAFMKGAYGGFTGAPGEDTCRHCHDSYPLNLPVGTVVVEGFPETYVPGETYSITVTVASTSSGAWGFQATVLTEKNKRAGKLLVTDRPHTQTVLGVFQTERVYIEQTKAGAYKGQAGGATWTFDWKAPKKARGVCTIYVCTNIANSNGKPSGDFILYAEQSATPAV